MISDQQLLTTLALSGKFEPSTQIDSVRHLVGLQQLHQAFSEARPLSVLTGSSSTEINQLISSFLDGIDSDVTVVRVAKICSDALEGMSEVVRATGFNSANMNLMELEITFMKFLSLQRFQQLRTIFLVEESPDNAGWVRDKVRDLVELEAAGNFGLMVILSRRANSHQATDAPTVDAEMPLVMRDRTKTLRKLFPRATSIPPPYVENESGSVEWNIGMDSDATVPLQKFPQLEREKLHDLTLEQPRLMIGRAEDNDLCIKARNVSRHHAILVRHGAAAVVMDLNSTNGTYVNSRRIKDQVVVHHDIIEIGAHRIRFIASNVEHWDQ